MQPSAPSSLQQALAALIEHKRLQGKVSAYKKLEAARARLDEYTGGAETPLAGLTPEWVAAFGEWMTSKKRLAENTRASYMRSMFTACRKAAKAGAAVDLAAFPVECRANAAPRAKEGTAVINPERDRWYAMRCLSVSSEDMEKILADERPGVETFRTDVSRTVETRQGKRRQVVELLKDVLFFCTTPRNCQRMKFAYHDRAYIYDYKSGDRRELAVVSANDLRVFMYLNELEPERILYYFPGEADCPKIEEGVRVRIVEGKCKGLTATVTRQSRANPLEAEVLVSFPVINTTAKAYLPWRFLAECDV